MRACVCVCIRACVSVRSCVRVSERVCVCVCGGEKGERERSGKSKERWGRVRELDGLLSASHFFTR